MEEKQESIILSSESTRFITYFIRSYNKNCAKGQLVDACHDAAAIVLFLADLLGERVQRDE